MIWPGSWAASRHSTLFTACVYPEEVRWFEDVEKDPYLWTHKFYFEGQIKNPAVPSYKAVEIRHYKTETKSRVERPKRNDDYTFCLKFFFFFSYKVMLFYEIIHAIYIFMI